MSEDTMRRFFFGRLSFGICFLSQKNSGDRSSQKIIAMERAALDRWGKGDPQGYLDIMAPEVTYFDPTSEKRLDGVDAVKEYIARVTGQIRIESYDMINPQVQRDADTAVLTFNLIDT